VVVRDIARVLNTFFTFYVRLGGFWWCLQVLMGVGFFAHCENGCVLPRLTNYTSLSLYCKRRSNNPSLKRPGIPVAPE
jgi:hypothetical protein